MANIFTKVIDGLAGGALGTITDTIKSYFPPSMSEQEQNALALQIQKEVNAVKKDLTDKLVQVDALYMGDIQNARMNNKHSKMPAIICGALTVGMFAFVGALFTLTIPEENMRLVDTLFGSYLTAWLGSINYWVGTTRSSAEKSKQQLIEVSQIKEPPVKFVE